MSLKNWPMRLDGWLVERTSQLSEWACQNSTRSNYWWAAHFFVFDIVLNILYAYTENEVMPYVFATMAITGCTGLIAAAISAHRTARGKIHAVAQTGISIARAMRLLVAVGWVVILVSINITALVNPARLGVTDALLLFSHLSFLAGLYLLSCPPKPPRYDREKLKGVPIKL